MPRVSTTSPSGTSPLIAKSALCSQKITGSGSRTAAAISPTTSAGVDGATTFSPGMAIAQPSTLWLCWAPKRRPAPLAVRSTSGKRDLPVGHVARLGDLVGDHVPGHREEVREHQLRDRAQAGHRRAHRRADDGLLADRRVADTRRAELVEQALGQLEDASGRPDVLADQHDARVAPHLLGDARRDRAAVCQFRHAEPPSLQTWVSSTSAAGSGAARASASADATASRVSSSIASSVAPSTPASSSRAR